MIRFAPKPAPQPASSCRDTAVARMSDDMREMAFAGENVSPETLEQRGWPAELVRKLSREAVQRARRMSVRQLQGPASGLPLKGGTEGAAQ